MSRRWVGWAATALAAATLYACATSPIETAKTTLPMSQLPGWAGEDYAAAFAAVQNACGAQPPASRGQVCRDAVVRGSLDVDASRRFLEGHFRAEPIEGEGLLTAYFSPTYLARHAPDETFSAPIRPRPANPDTAGDRAHIERMPARDALAWMRPEDLFLMQVQGSGVVVFPDGARQRAVYAATNGLPFVAIAKPMTIEGLLAPADATAGNVRAWLAAHRGPEAKAEMDKDPRYVFFRLVADDGAQPDGASGAGLVPGRSLAIDPAYHRYFELLWIDAHAAGLSGAHPAYQRLAVALDRGGAILGPVRADLFLGGDGDEAGQVRHALRLYRIVPAQP